MQASSLFDSGESTHQPGGERGASVQSETASTRIASESSSLYRKYRPRSFDSAELVGQDHIVRTLRNAVALDRVAHAYLFSGPRGTGKTTTARLLAKAVNCLDPDPSHRPCNLCANCQAINAGSSPDIIEIDAASNRGIDDIRDLRDRIRYAPTQLPSKVYIIDEAHQITGAAANAFLKTLEEPPSHSRFILATTDPEELLPTIVSRCQQFEFRRIGMTAMESRLRNVAELERIPTTDEALTLIARHATGSLRDGLGLLERLALQAASAGQESASITANDVRTALGLSKNDRVEAIVSAIAERDAGAGLAVIQEAIEEGEDPRQLNRQLVAFLRSLLLKRSGGGDVDEASNLAERFALAELAQHARRFSEIDFSIKHSPFPQLPLEVAVVEAAGYLEPQPQVRESEPSAARQADSSHVPEHPRPTSLRDRVRNPAATRNASAPAVVPTAQEPAQITPLRPVSPPSPASASPTAPAGGGDVDVEHIANLWPSVRADVKALNRRIEALLSEVDPVAVTGNQITLAVPYPFHRDKLNSDDVRDTVGGVLSRLLGRTFTLQCVLRGEVMPAHASAADSMSLSSPGIAPPTTSGSDLAAEDQSIDEELVRARIRAAKNIFDAEEVDPIEFAPTEENGARG